MNNETVTPKDILQELLTRYGFSESVIDEREGFSSSERGSKIFSIHVSEEDSRLLIGQYGNNLRSLQHIARTILARKFPNLSSVAFILDVNEYQKKKDQQIANLAREAAREAEKSQKTVYLRPMSAYDRRLVHMELAKESRVVTESVGEGEIRRVVVKPLLLEK